MDQAKKTLHEEKQALRYPLTELSLGRAAAQAETGMTAHYEFASVHSGRYTLFATTELGESSYVWWKEVAVEGKSVHADLNNKVAFEWPERFCAALTH